MSRRRVLGFTTAGLLLSYVFVQTNGIAAAGIVSEQTAEGDERLQRIAGPADRRSAGAAARFTDVLLLVSYWIPAFVAIVVIDWRIRTRNRATIDPAQEITPAADATAALVAFVLAYLAAVPFMSTTLIQGPVAVAWRGADVAYFVDLAVAALFYGGYRAVRARL